MRAYTKPTWHRNTDFPAKPLCSQLLNNIQINGDYCWVLLASVLALPLIREKSEYLTVLGGAEEDEITEFLCIVLVSKNLDSVSPFFCPKADSSRYGCFLIKKTWTKKT